MNQFEIAVKLLVEERKYYDACDRLSTCHLELGDLLDLRLLDLVMDILGFDEESEAFCRDYWMEEARYAIRAGVPLKNMVEWLAEEAKGITSEPPRENAE